MALNELGTQRNAHRTGALSTPEWLAIPARERFELLATIAEMRAWRDKPSDRPIQPAAFELHQWLTRTCHKGATPKPGLG